MTEQEEFEFRLRLENEQSGLVQAEQIPPQLTMVGDEPKAPTMSEVVKEAIGRTVTRIPAAISAAGTYYGTLGESEFPSQLPPQGATEQAMDRFSRGLGLRPELRPATQGQRYAMTAAEGIFDPLNLVGLGGVKTGLGLVQKGIFSREGARTGLQLGAGGTAAVGGEFGGDVGGQIAGTTGQIIGGIGTAILLGGGTLTAGQKLFDKAQFDPKDFDIADMANAEGISKAQDLVKQAIDADPNLQAKLKTVQDRVLFVTGKQGTAAVTGIDNITLKGKLEQLARDDLTFATEVKQLYADLKIAVNKKANELFPAPSAEIPSAKTKIAEQEIDYNQRIGFIDNPNPYETLQDLLSKTALDELLYGGFYLKGVCDKTGQLAELYHVDYSRVRSNEHNSEFYISDCWVNTDGTYKANLKPDEYETLPCYDPNKKQKVFIFYYKSYRPGLKTGEKDLLR